MLNPSRIAIYDYVYNLIYDEEVLKNVYKMFEPQELNESDVKDGFVVIRVGDLNDASEFDYEAFGTTRVFIEAYIPPKSRGRLDEEAYERYENAINDAIANAPSDGTYFVQNGSTLSSDIEETRNANNIFFTFIRSFVVVIDENN